MKLEYTLMPEDFRELSAGVNHTRRSIRPTHLLLLWLVYFGSAVFFALHPLPGTKPPSGPHNLWVCLAPSLCISTFLLVGVLTNPMRVQPTQERKPAESRKLRLAGYISAVSGIWMVPAAWPQLAIYWSPTDWQWLWAAFAPWFLYFGLARSILAHRRKRAVDEAFANSPSAHRPNRVEITPSGISAEDGLADLRFQWAYFKSYGETKSLIVLTNIDGVPALILAKRAVPDDRAMDELKMLISEHIAEGEFARKQSAFPVIVPTDAAVGSSAGRVE